MNKKHVVVLLILTNVISVGLVLLFMSSSHPQQEKPAIPHISNKKPNHTQQVQEKPKQTTKMQVDSIISQYDVIKSGRYRDSIEKYKHALKNEPTYSSTLTPAYVYAKEGNYSKAIEICEKDIQDYPHWPAHFYTLAWINAKVGKYDKAIEISEKTIRLYPRYSKIWHILAWVYAKLGERDKAIDACNQALKHEPDSAEVHYGLGRIYGMLGNHEQAIELFKKSIQLKSDFVEAYLFMGMTYAERGNTKEAIQSYRDAILFDKLYPEAHFFLGVAYDESGQYEKAIQAFEDAIKWYSWNAGETKVRIHAMGVKPDMANIHCILGVCYLRLGKLSDALYHFSKSVEIDDLHSEAHYGLALTNLLSGNKDAALEEYEKVKTLKGEDVAKSLLDIIQNANSMMKGDKKWKR